MKENHNEKCSRVLQISNGVGSMRSSLVCLSVCVQFTLILKGKAII